MFALILDLFKKPVKNIYTYNVYIYIFFFSRKGKFKALFEICYEKYI